MERLDPQIRTFRLSRIQSVDTLEPTGYRADPVVSRSFDPVTATIYLAPGTAEHLRIRGEFVGSDDRGWDGYRFTEANWPRLLDHLNLLGVKARTDHRDYRVRLEHIAGLESHG